MDLAEKSTSTKAVLVQERILFADHGPLQSCRHPKKSIEKIDKEAILYLMAEKAFTCIQEKPV
jgi:hypothetical protein